MKKLLLLLTLSVMLFSCSTHDNELIVSDDLLNSEKLYVNPDGSNVMAAVGTPIYAKLVNANTVHFFWDPQFTMRAILTYDIVLRYKEERSASGPITINPVYHTYAMVVSAGTSSSMLPFLPAGKRYVLTGVEEFTGTLSQGGLFQNRDGRYLRFYTNGSLTQQAYLFGNAVVSYGVLKTTTNSSGSTTVLESVGTWVVPLWCESYQLPQIFNYAEVNGNIITFEYMIFSCVWQ